MSTIDHLNHPGNPDHDPSKDLNWIPLDSKSQAKAAAKKTLALIEQAQALLYEAARVSCDLQGWCKEWQQIGNHADATKDLWHQVNHAPRPTGHDGFPTV